MLRPSKVCKYCFKVKLRGLTGKKYFSSQNLVKPSGSGLNLVQPGPKIVNLAICSRLATLQLFQQRVVHLKIALKASLQLESCLVPGRFLRFSTVQQVMGRT